MDIRWRVGVTERTFRIAARVRHCSRRYVMILDSKSLVGRKEDPTATVSWEALKLIAP